MDIETIRKWIEANGEESFSRSSGAGGQNVNKVSTKALLRISILNLGGISHEERLRLLAALGNRLSVDGDFVIQVQDERSQIQNRELAVERMIQAIVKALHREKARKKTKPTKAARERRLVAKKSRGTKKKNRSNSIDSD